MTPAETDGRSLDLHPQHTEGSANEKKKKKDALYDSEYQCCYRRTKTRIF
jgi:hypothetical protein